MNGFITLKLHEWLKYMLVCTCDPFSQLQRAVSGVSEFTCEKIGSQIRELNHAHKE